MRQLLVNKFGRCKLLFHAHIVGIGEHERHVLIDKIGYAGNLLEIHLCGYLADVALAIASLNLVGKGIDSGCHQVHVDRSAVGHREHGHDALTTCDVLIECYGFLLIAADRQEVIDILIILQSGHHHYKESYEQGHESHAEATTLLKIVKYAKE